MDMNMEKLEMDERRISKMEMLN